MKIVLIGPTYPFRGGIAHYTTLLCKALRKEHEVKFISFKRQYPKLLFPGKSDRDPSKNPLKIEGVDYLIDSINPLTWITAAQAIRDFIPEKIIIPWWVSFWIPQFWSILTIIKRKLKAEIVIICHNVIEHESNFLKKWATKAILSKADRLITHSRAEAFKLKELLGNDINVISGFLPTYKDVTGKRYSKESARKKLRISGNILLFFGLIREYKGLSVLLDALPMVVREKEVILLVVGEFWGDKQKYFEQIHRNQIFNNVRIVDKYVPNEEIGLYFSAADIVVQPYLSATGSAVCQLAYGFDRPVIATNVGSLQEVIQDGINGRIVEPNNSQALAKAILESLEPHSLIVLSDNAAETKEKFSWENMAVIVTGMLSEGKQGTT